MMATCVCVIHPGCLNEDVENEDGLCQACIDDPSDRRVSPSPAPSTSGPLEVLTERDLISTAPYTEEQLAGLRDASPNPGPLHSRAAAAAHLAQRDGELARARAALEVARRALEEIRDGSIEPGTMWCTRCGTNGGHRDDCSCATASRALAALGGTTAPADEREHRGCPNDCDLCHESIDSFIEAQAATPVAQRRPARELAAEFMGDGRLIPGARPLKDYLNDAYCRAVAQAIEGLLEADRRGGL